MRFPLIALFLALLLHAEVTPEREAFLAAHLAKEIRRRSTVINSPQILNYVNGIARKLSPDREFKLEIIVDHNDEPQELPDGQIFIPTRVFLLAKTDSEFAGILAHSMAHVTTRHSFRGPRGQATIPMIWIGFIRPQEQQEEADRIAVATMSAAGYNPLALRDYVFRSYVPKARLTNIDETIRGLRAPEQYETENDLPKIQAELHRLIDSPTRSDPPSLRRAPSLRR